VVRFKTEVIRHLPVLVFGDRHKLTEGGWVAVGVVVLLLLLALPLT
jgi:hypothetical protein